MAVNFTCKTNPNLKLEFTEDNSALVGEDGLEWVFGNADRTSYVLTMEDGTKVYLNETDGVTKTVDAIGNTMTYSEDGFISGDGKGVRFERDFECRITKISDDFGHERSYAYDEDGNLYSYTDGAGNTVTYMYDNDHRLAQIIDPTGIAVARYEYDENGRLVATLGVAGSGVYARTTPTPSWLLKHIPFSGWGLGSAPVRISIKLTSSMQISDPLIPFKTVVIEVDFLGF